MDDSVEAVSKLAKQISEFVREKYDEFLDYDYVKIYYDNWQVEVSRLLSTAF